MGVYIKGMEMPTRCGRCDMCVPEADGDIDWHNVCCITGADIVDVGEKMVDCPLDPVQPHGDLIDRDELKHKIGQFSTAWEYGQGVSDCWEALNAAPTVIPKEEGE